MRPEDYVPCGTTTAYRRHVRWKMEPCDECKAAWREYHREYRKRRSDA